MYRKVQSRRRIIKNTARRFPGASAAQERMDGCTSHVTLFLSRLRSKRLGTDHGTQGMRERPGFVVAGLLWLIKMIKYNAEIGCELSSA